MEEEEDGGSSGGGDLSSWAELSVVSSGSVGPRPQQRMENVDIDDDHITTKPTSGAGVADASLDVAAAAAASAEKSSAAEGASGGGAPATTTTEQLLRLVVKEIGVIQQTALQVGFWPINECKPSRWDWSGVEGLWLWGIEANRCEWME